MEEATCWAQYAASMTKQTMEVTKEAVWVEPGDLAQDGPDMTKYATRVTIMILADMATSGRTVTPWQKERFKCDVNAYQSTRPKTNNLKKNSHLRSPTEFGAFLVDSVA